MKCMSRYLLALLVFSLVGCSSRRQYGFALVNRTDKDFKDIEVVSGTAGKDFEVYRTKGSELPARGFVRIFPHNGGLHDETTVSWKEAGLSHQQTVSTKVPSGFKGWMCIEFTDDGVQVAHR